MLTRLILITLLALPIGGSPWEKSPDKWSLADVYKILQESPWSPASTKLETEYTSRNIDGLNGVATEAPSNPNNENLASGVQLNRSKPLPAFPVLWWSSKTVRLARQRLCQLRNANGPSKPLSVDALPDYVLAIEGNEALRILHDPKADLHDTVFLELPGGATLDLESAQFFDATEQEEARVEFHFPRQKDGAPTIDPDSDRLIFHCKASAKSPSPRANNTLSLRAEFRPRTMRLHGTPDL